MRKLFFIFAMLLVAVTSAVAEEKSELFNRITGSKDSKSFKGDHFTILADFADRSGIMISNGKKITINSNDGEIITRVDLTYVTSGTYGSDYVQVLSGTGTIDDNTKYNVTNGNAIYDVNATSLIIGSSVEGSDFRIKKIEIYYYLPNNGNEEENDFVMDEYVQTVSFSLDGAPSYSRNNITVTVTDGGGLQISANKNDAITENIGMEIVKVDLELSYNNGSPIESTAGNVKGSDLNWSINRIYSSALTISNLGANNAQVKNVKVYYRWISEEKTEHFDVADINNCSGNSVSIIGTENYYNYNMELTDNNSVTITANDGVEIAKVDLHFEWYRNTTEPIESTAGTIDYSDSYNCSINDVNSTSLKITHPAVGEDYQVVIDDITVYYRTKFSTIDVTANLANDAYWTTFYSEDGNYQTLDGTQVFTVKLNGTKIEMAEVGNGVVKKGQGVVLKSTTTGNITMFKVGDDEVNDGDYSDNNLVGTSVDITNPGNAYVLYYKPASGVGFYKLTSNGTIAKNKAYLIYNQPGNARAFFAFDGETTGIEDNIVVGNEEDDKVYDLQGRRVAKPVNGLYIVNGKKVIMNKR